ncbi:MAG: SPOR domain-containing protein [Leptothrix sp. (in: b-proteobacteria)]
MGLISFLQSKRQARERSRAVPADPSQLEQVRTRARRRLIGAVVLVMIAVIGLPLLFDAKPRQLPANIAVDIARRDGGAAAAQSPVAPPATPERAGAMSPATEPVVAPAGPRADAPATGRESAARPAAAPAPAKTAPDSARAQALLDARPAAKKPAPDAAARFVVQVGAFEQSTAAHEARARVEKLGLRTYEQEVGSASGKRTTRVRIGPFSSREDADRAAAKVRAHGVSATVLAL